MVGRMPMLNITMTTWVQVVQEALVMPLVESIIAQQQASKGPGSAPASDDLAPVRPLLSSYLCRRMPFASCSGLIVMRLLIHQFQHLLFHAPVHKCALHAICRSFAARSIS